MQTAAIGSSVASQVSSITSGDALKLGRLLAKAEKAVETFITKKLHWSFDRIEESHVVRSAGKTTTVKVTALDGGHDEGIFYVKLDTHSGKVLKIKQTQPFTP